MNNDRKHLINGERSLGRDSGMQRLDFTQTRLAPGQHSDPIPGRATEEGFLFVVSGMGLLEFNSESLTLETGDCIGMPDPSEAYRLSNPFVEDFVYLLAVELSTAERR